MGRIKKQIGIALDPDILSDLDEWRKQQFGTPSRTAVIEQLLQEFLKQDSDAKKQKG